MYLISVEAETQKIKKTSTQNIRRRKIKEIKAKLEKAKKKNQTQKKILMLKNYGLKEWKVMSNLPQIQA